jgi:hypothetical protein
MEYQNGGANPGYGFVGAVKAMDRGEVVTMPLDELEKQLVEARERAFRAATRVREIADALLGPVPESPDKIGASGTRLGRIGSLNGQADSIHAALSELDRQLARLGPLG